MYKTEIENVKKEFEHSEEVERWDRVGCRCLCGSQIIIYNMKIVM